MWTLATVASPPRSRGDVMFILTYKRAFLWQFIAVIVMDLLSLMSQKLRQWPVRGEGSLDSAAEDGSGLAGDKLDNLSDMFHK